MLKKLLEVSLEALAGLPIHVLVTSPAHQIAFWLLVVIAIFALVGLASMKWKPKDAERPGDNQRQTQKETFIR